jgi:hypothetical protein
MIALFDSDVLHTTITVDDIVSNIFRHVVDGEMRALSRREGL